MEFPEVEDVLMLLFGELSGEWGAEGNENWLAACRVKDQLQPEGSQQNLERRVRVIASFPFKSSPHKHGIKN